jgi:hypothetical protein
MLTLISLAMAIPGSAVTGGAARLTAPSCAATGGAARTATPGGSARFGAAKTGGPRIGVRAAVPVRRKPLRRLTRITTGSSTSVKVAAVLVRRPRPNRLAGRRRTDRSNRVSGLVHAGASKLRRTRLRQTEVNRIRIESRLTPASGQVPRPSGQGGLDGPGASSEQGGDRRAGTALRRRTMRSRSMAMMVRPDCLVRRPANRSSELRLSADRSLASQHSAGHK